MNEDSVKQKDTAQDHAEAVTADLVQLAGRILNRINNKRPISPQQEEYKVMSDRYFECLLNASEIVPTTTADFTLPSDPLKAVWKVRGFVNRLKKHGLYRVSLKKAKLS